MLSIAILADCFNCNHNVKNKAKADVSFVNSVAVDRKVYIDRLIESIESSDCVYGRYTGVMGEESQTYKDFETLCQLAPDTLWYKLSHSQSAVMRIYSYKALELKNPKLALIVRKSLENDTAAVCCHDGDLGFHGSVEYVIKNF